MIATHITVILLVTGLLTMGAVTMFIMPRPMLRLFFGVVSPDEATRIVAQHWGLLVALVGALLVLAAYRPALQVPAMAIAVAEKLAIAGLVLGSSLRRRALLLTVVAGDVVMAILYLIVTL